MARPTLTTHPKFFRLASLVGGRGVARGALELIWDAAYASGDPNVGDSLSVEAVADWRGTRGELTAALVSSGFLDVVQTDANGSQLQTFAVHDLEDHAPDYVLKRWQREAQRRQNGETIRTVRQRAATLRWGAVKSEPTMPVDASDRRLLTSVAPPAPAPITDLSLSSPIPSVPTLLPDPERAIPPAPPVPLSGYTLGQLFAVLRADVFQTALPWKTPLLNHAKADAAAEMVVENQAEAELRPSILAFWEAVKAGTVDGDPQKILKDSAWAFGCWAKGFQHDVERLRGVAPKARPDARAGPRRDHRTGHVRAEDMKHTETGEHKW